MADIIDDYLQEGFDPRTVTVPRLRSILVTHNVEYPSTAKKGELVELVRFHVLSQASKLRAQKLKAKRSSLGFINAGSADDSNFWDEQETRSRQSSHRRSMSPRKSYGRMKADPEESEANTLRSPRKRSSRSASRQLSHVNDDDNDDDDGSPTVAPRSIRRSSRRAVTPQIKSESDLEREDRLTFTGYSTKYAPTPTPAPANVQKEDEEEDDEDEEEDEEEEDYDDEDDDHMKSVFTDDNPFQGGGTSPVTPVTPSGRRRTTGEDFTKSTRSVTRRTGDLLNKPKTPRNSARSPLKPHRKSPEFTLEPGEEFTVDEQLELEDAQQRGQVAVASRNRPKSTRQTSIMTPIFVLLMALLGAYGAWYRQEKLAVGYCGLGRAARSLLPTEIAVPDFLVPFVEPQCEPCPQNAYCYEGFAVRCIPGFLLRPHPLSFAGLVPLPPTCEPDSEQERRVQAVADKAVEELRERRAQYECGGLVDDAGHQAESPAISEVMLKKAVSNKRSKRLTDKEFDELWEKAIGKVTMRDEVEVQVEPARTSGSANHSARSLSSTSLARLPLTCAIKRSIWLGLARNRLAIGLLILLVLGTLHIRSRYRLHVKTAAQVPALVNLVLGRLADQRELGEEDLDDPWLFLPNLRDDVLRNIHTLSERDRIWQRVRAVVEQNSNVRTSQREGRSGEVGRAWEWIGPTKGEGARRRRTGARTSLASESREEETPDAIRKPEVKTWQEARPMY